ncbi:hypothetical protein U1Q18_010580, partial [Sarracenia purpurea var. burkii]
RVMSPLAADKTILITMFVVNSLALPGVSKITCWREAYVFAVLFGDYFVLGQ